MQIWLKQLKEKCIKLNLVEAKLNQRATKYLMTLKEKLS